MRRCGGKEKGPRKAGAPRPAVGFAWPLPMVAGAALWWKRKRTAQGGPSVFFVSISIVAIPNNSDAYVVKIFG